MAQVCRCPMSRAFLRDVGLRYSKTQSRPRFATNTFFGEYQTGIRGVRAQIHSQ